jgi:hypothetical protein
MSHLEMEIRYTSLDTEMEDALKIGAVQNRCRTWGRGRRFCGDGGEWGSGFLAHKKKIPVAASVCKKMFSSEVDVG